MWLSTHLERDFKNYRVIYKSRTKIPQTLWNISLTHIQRKMELSWSHGWGGASVNKAIFHTRPRSTSPAFLDCSLWIFHQEQHKNMNKWVNPHDNVRIYPSLPLQNVQGIPWRLASMSSVNWNIHDDVKGKSDVNSFSRSPPSLQYAAQPSALLLQFVLVWQT